MFTNVRFVAPKKRAVRQSMINKYRFFRTKGTNKINNHRLRKAKYQTVLHSVGKIVKRVVSEIQDFYFNQVWSALGIQTFFKYLYKSQIYFIACESGVFVSEDLGYLTEIPVHYGWGLVLVYVIDSNLNRFVHDYIDWISDWYLKYKL